MDAWCKDLAQLQHSFTSIYFECFPHLFFNVGICHGNKSSRLGNKNACVELVEPIENVFFFLHCAVFGSSSIELKNIQLRSFILNLVFSSELAPVHLGVDVERVMDEFRARLVRGGAS